MGNFFQNVQGRPDDSGHRTTRRRIVFNQAGATSANGVAIGAIEKGGIPVRAYALVNIAFSAGTTVSLGAAANPATGFAANPSAYMATGDVAPQTAGGKGAGPGAALAGGPLMGVEAAADTIVYAYIAGTVPTAGDITFIVEYCPAYPWSDLNGGQAT